MLNPAANLGIRQIFCPKGTEGPPYSPYRFFGTIGFWDKHVCRLGPRVERLPGRHGGHGPCNHLGTIDNRSDLMVMRDGHDRHANLLREQHTPPRRCARARSLRAA
jgi:hypothetical protein